ncbi:MAG: ATP-binding protein, partial [Myxococcota bacterium]|nr:ATP-binding protein [Myxococcota bacterium]
AVEVRVSGLDAELTIETQSFEQSLTNIVLNAADAMDGQGTVVIELMEDEDAYIVEISDEGPGISIAHRAHVFEPFWSSKPHGSGTGLGLSMSKRLITDMGGRLLLREPQPGQGAVFAIYLPKILAQPAT